MRSNWHGGAPNEYRLKMHGKKKPATGKKGHILSSPSINMEYSIRNCHWNSIPLFTVGSERERKKIEACCRMILKGLRIECRTVTDIRTHSRTTLPRSIVSQHFTIECTNIYYIEFCILLSYTMLSSISRTHRSFPTSPKKMVAREVCCTDFNSIWPF